MPTMRQQQPELTHKTQPVSRTPPRTKQWARQAAERLKRAQSCPAKMGTYRTKLSREMG